MRGSYQDWCVDTIAAIFRSRMNYLGDWRDQGYIYVIKAIINHYASMYYCGAKSALMNNRSKEHVNLWWDHLNEANRKAFFSPLLMSTAALRRAKGRTPAKELKHYLHLEHITPVGWIYNRLCKLCDEKCGNMTRADILDEFKYNRLVLLTKKQSKKFLDGAKQHFAAKDIHFLRTHFPVFADKYDSELNQLVDDKTHSKDSGFGLLRMAKLVNFGISFCYADGRDCPPESWMDYFNKSMALDQKGDR